MTEAPRIGIGVAIRKNGQLLLGHRKSAHATGDWSFTGGHLEHGETPAECALRETAEESGLTISTPWLGIVTNNIFKNGRHYITLIMIADWISGEPQNLEPDKLVGWQWFNWDALPAPLMAPIVSMQQAGFNPVTALQPEHALLL